MKQALGRLRSYSSWMLRRLRYCLTVRQEVRHQLPRSALKCEIAYNQYGAYCVPDSSRHRPAARQILSGAVYEHETIQFILTHARDGDVVHAGTFFGDFLPALAHSREGGARIWAFEPNAESHRAARITILLNDLTNVGLHSAALGSESGRTFLHTHTDSGVALGGASKIDADVEPRDRFGEWVSVVRLDGVVPPNRHVPVIHLDVEGFEVEALEGSKGLIKRCRPIIIVETLPSQTWRDEHLVPLGYTVAGEIGGNSILKPR